VCCSALQYIVRGCISKASVRTKETNICYTAHSSVLLCGVVQCSVVRRVAVCCCIITCKESSRCIEKKELYLGIEKNHIYVCIYVCIHTHIYIYINIDIVHIYI